MPDKVYRTAIYCRLSREDGDKVESNSIASQRAICEDYMARHEDLELVCEPFVDDGISGVTMDRPGFADMIQQLEQGKAAAVFVKDLSRLGRNYIEVGRLTEEFFPNHDIRLVAVSDNIDTDEGENELAPIRNLFNEWYQRMVCARHQQEAAHQQQDQGKCRRTHGAASLRVRQRP
ncbi:MAG: recombinase family protein [Eubacteriales bacterium]|nr:recombinase family protein [Eubacteriales bacterium]